MTSCPMPGVPQLHPTLAHRFSPVRFREDTTVSRAQVDTLLDAARRAPSAGNSQPWHFVVGTRGDSVHRRIVPLLARSSAAWAPTASLIMVNLAVVGIEDAPEWEYSEFARYDLGQAVAHMSIQALTIGLDAHQFRAFDREAVAVEFSIPAHVEVTSMTAFGVADHAPDEVPSPGTSRERRTVAQVIWEEPQDGVLSRR
ncbi:nitroreductase [Janibacter sp. Soil728]|uniref:nitroreductase family protein n=1 Tax=Janibacter sp. Soil728 TaxID=1736393 RepID=UPI0007023468|nr:nitroreductase family protein [Janibacter sp. Soil728]KRE37748.1 nitroreductase [Janibacter sp. Soil728]